MLFPGTAGGRYAALTRPMPQSFSRICGIWIAFSDDLVNWGGHERLALPRWGYWDELRTGASAVPFLTDHGWLELADPLSCVHQAVSYRPITRYEVTGGYLNLPGLTVHDPNPAKPAREETS